MQRSTDNLRNINSQYSRTEGLVLLVQNLFEEAINKMVLLASKADYSGENQFYFEDYPDLYKQAQNVVNRLAFDVTTLIGSSTSDAWMRANKEQDTFVKEVLNQAGINDLDSLTPSAVHRYFNNHEQAMHSFQKRVINGLSLSQNVWNYANNARLETQLGVSISSAISEGKSAAELAKEVKQYLNEPNKLFRRVRDKFGTLRLSKPAKKYHPKAGIYRSSYRNALRLARNEINMAYRVAESERWNDLDFVIGIEIKRSIYSSEKGSRYNCDDVCERLKGRYPKDFNFVGWHVNCRCYAIPILCSKEEMKELTRRIVHNEPTDDVTFEGEVTETPHNFGEWISDNSTRIKDADKEGRLPYFIRENVGYVENYIDADMTDTKPIFNKEPLDVSITHTIAEGKQLIDLDNLDKFNFDDEMDNYPTPQAYFAHLQGFDGLPMLVDSMSELGENVMFRGVKDYLVPLSDEIITAQDAMEMFKTGEMFAGKGHFGNGTYTTSSKKYALEYADNENGILTMATMSGFKMIDYEDIEKISDSLAPKLLHWTGAMPFNDKGALATALGYDGIRYYSENAGLYIYVILNRTKLKVLK